MRKIVLGAVALVATVGVAWGAGQFAGLPIVGSGSYCQGTSTSSTGGAACTTTVPAGPQSATSGMLIPTDTEYANGAQPQTVYTPLRLLGGLPPTIATPTNGTTVTVAATTGTLILTPAGTITGVGIQLPNASTLIDGQIIRINSTQTISSALLVAGGTGNTVSNAPTALTVSATLVQGYAFMYHALTYASGAPATGIWYRVQ